jgi:ABC-2 type transport system ATP-binding protein
VTATPNPPPPPPPPPPERTAVAVNRVGKWFGDVVALSEVTFRLESGVTSLLGPNGAGKTTLLKILAGMLAPSTGTVSLLGKDPRRDRVSLMRYVGLVPQSDGLFEQQSALRFVRDSALLHGLQDADARARSVLALVGFDPNDSRPVKALSKGNRQKLRIAQALVHDPEIVLMDEPLDGLDPAVRAATIRLVRRLGQQGRTVLVSSHVLDEVERIGSRVIVMARGRLVAEGDFHRIRRLMDDRPLRVAISASDPARLAAELLGERLVNAVSVGESSLLVDTTDVFRFRKRLAPLALACGCELLEVQPAEEDLESVFMYLMSKWGGVQ